MRHCQFCGHLQAHPVGCPNHPLVQDQHAWVKAISDYRRGQAYGYAIMHGDLSVSRPSNASDAFHIGEMNYTNQIDESQPFNERVALNN